MGNLLRMRQINQNFHWNLRLLYIFECLFNLYTFLLETTERQSKMHSTFPVYRISLIFIISLTTNIYQHFNFWTSSNIPATVLPVHTMSFTICTFGSWKNWSSIMFDDNSVFHDRGYYESHRTVESHKKFVYRPLPQTSTTAPTYFCMFTILILNSQSTFNCNCYQEPDWLF